MTGSLQTLLIVVGALVGGAIGALAAVVGAALGASTALAMGGEWSWPAAILGILACALVAYAIVRRRMERSR